MTQELDNEIEPIVEIDDEYIPRRSEGETIIKTFLFIFASIATIFVFLIIIFLFNYGTVFFTNYPINSFLFGEIWYPALDIYGALTPIVGSLLVSLGAILIAMPLGLLTAIYIAEIAPPKVRKILKFSVEVLAGIPSIVYGYFGTVILSIIVRDYFNLNNGFVWLSGSLILAIMALPTIITVSEDAIRAVPNYYREASYAMGATKWQTIRNVVLPAGFSGITAALVLGMGRALGETMAVMLVVRNRLIIPDPLTNMLSGIGTITATIGYEWGAASSADDSLQRPALISLGIVLFMMTFIINMIAVIILNRVRRKFTGEKGKKKLSKLLNRGKNETQSQKLAKIKYFLRANKKLIFYFFISLCIGWIILSWSNLFYAILCVLGLLGLIFLIRSLSAINQQRFWYGIIALAVFVVLFAVSSLVGYIVVNGIEGIMQPGFLTDYPRLAGREGGIFPAIIGTLQLVVGSVIFAVPLGICAGIYLSEYAKDTKFTRIIRAGVDNLNGTPSIIFGLFGYMFFVSYFGFGRSLLAGCLTLGLMILPTIIKTSEEAIKAIPQEFREGSLALGSSKWQSISKVVLPAAVPGVVTGTVLGMGRSAGETAPLMFTAVTSQARFITIALFEPVMALTYHLFRMMGDIQGTQVNAAGTALVLLITVIFLYGIAFIIRNHYEKKKLW